MQIEPEGEIMFLDPETEKFIYMSPEGTWTEEDTSVGISIAAGALIDSKWFLPWDGGGDCHVV